MKITNLSLQIYPKIKLSYAALLACKNTKIQQHLLDSNKHFSLKEWRKNFK